MSRRVLVTGGAGFIGRHLVDALAARGDSVTVLEHSGAPHRDDVRWIRGDIRDAAVVSQAIAGHETVFHNASIVHTRHDHVGVVWSVNHDGSKNVLAACQEHGVGRLVYVSSASAVYEGRDIEGGDETMPYSRISQAPYADSKIAAEKLLLGANGQSGVAIAAIRPHVVFGPGDTRFLPAILKRARAGKLKFAVGRGKKLSDFTYVSNLIDALLATEERLEIGSPVAGQAFFITNGEPIEFFGFVREVLGRLNLPPIRATVPFEVAFTVAAAVETIKRIRGDEIGGEDGMTTFAIRYMCTHHYFDIGKARRLLGWSPKVSIHEGIERTVAHLASAPPAR